MKKEKIISFYLDYVFKTKYDETFLFLIDGYKVLLLSQFIK